MSMQSESLPPLAPPPYYYHNSDSIAARPSLGFPLGTALLLVVIFSLSGVFSCCYHWDKLRSLTRSFSHQTIVDLEAPTHLHGPSKPKINHMSLKGKVEIEKSYTVLMPGDEMPKFIAMPCPCQPSRSELEGNIHLAVELLSKPPKPPRMAVPLY